MRVIVTGAASGIGLAVAHRLAADASVHEAARLTIVDLPGERLEAAATALRERGAEILAVPADLANPEMPERVVAAAVEAFGGLDGLVSNAGVLRPGSLLDLSLADYDLTFAVNTRPTWLLVRAAHPHLKATRGAIVATASIAAHHPIPSQGAYSASKAALLMMMRQFACELGPDGIRVNTVSPGSTLTGIAGTAIDPAVTERGGPARDRNPLGFISRAEDQAAAIAFLLSDDARFISGSDLAVDGAVQTQLMVKSGHPLARS